MKEKLEALFSNIKSLCESEVDRIIEFVASILSDNQQSAKSQSVYTAEAVKLLSTDTGTASTGFSAMSAAGLSRILLTL